MENANGSVSNDPSEKFRTGILLDPADPIDVHPAARRFHKVEGHEETLDKSLKSHGQLTDATIIRMGATRFLCDGLSRRRLLAEAGQPLRCREIDAAELGGKSVEEWILENNLNGATARQLNDTQRALQAAVFEPEIREAAEARTKSGRAVTDGEKGRTEDHLARIAGCKPSRIRQAIELKKEADERLVEAVWSGLVAISKALKISQIADTQSRNAALAAAKAGNKSRLRYLLDGRTLDGHHQPIPPTLLSVFEEAALVDKACKYFDDALETLRQLTTASIDLNRLRGMVNSLQDQKPFVVCPYCAGPTDQCAVCENNRWLSATRFEAARNEDIARRRGHR